MEKLRKPYQGLLNIIRFNWHFYLLSLSFILILIGASIAFKNPYQTYVNLICLIVTFNIIISLFVSSYIYDFSGLYQFNWIEENNTELRIVNINAGFDESSVLLQYKFKNSRIAILDFYDPAKHTEVSIKRARKAYPSHKETISINTSSINLASNSADKIFLIMAAHEIRNTNERIIFFKELNRILKNDGQIYVMEHLRDLPNFIAYSIGCFHFYSKNSWNSIFKSASFNISKEIKLTPFVSTFILNKNGNSL